jgi:hypothetical protein
MRRLPSVVCAFAFAFGSVLVGALGALTRGGTEHGEVDIPAILKNKGSLFKVIYAFQNDWWCR